VRLVLQRVTRARVTVADELVAAIGRGVVVLVGVARDDTAGDAERLAAKVARLRIFPAADGRTDISMHDAAAAALVISQFTLLADTTKGSRPSFSAAAAPDHAVAIYERFCTALRDHNVPVETGQFQAAMRVELVHDGPFTLLLDSA
jgi:D-aminoacyl-tRNA deacylase